MKIQTRQKINITVYIKIYRYIFQRNSNSFNSLVTPKHKIKEKLFIGKNIMPELFKLKD